MEAAVKKQKSTNARKTIKVIIEKTIFRVLAIPRWKLWPSAYLTRGMVIGWVSGR